MKIFLRTFGCQMNVRDSEIIRGMLEEKGYTFIDDPEKADIVIFNTCSVREHAEQKAISILAALARKKPRRIFGLVGCIAAHKKESLFKTIPNLDFIAGPSEIYKIPELIEGSRVPVPLTSFGYGAGQGPGSRKLMEIDGQSRPLEYLNPVYRESKENAYVNITYGCDNYCSYCIVPYVRGREVSRPVDDVIREVKELVDRGMRDIMLLGQNVNSYRYKEKPEYRVQKPEWRGMGFVRLLEKINDIDGVSSIRFMTSHPKDVSDDLFKAIGGLEHVAKELHLPLQSGSNTILNLMNRGYTIEHYEALINRYKKIVPGGKLTTDIIVGFPQEAEDDFEKTKKALKDIRFDSAFIFKYSPRPPAKSAAMKDDVRLEEKKRRNNDLLALQRKISAGKKGQG